MAADFPKGALGADVVTKAKKSMKEELRKLSPAAAGRLSGGMKEELRERMMVESVKAA